MTRRGGGHQVKIGAGAGVKICGAMVLVPVVCLIQFVRQTRREGEWVSGVNIVGWTV